MTSRLVSRIFGIAVTCTGLVALGSCDGSGSGSRADAASSQPTGSCSSGLEAGQACNTVANVASAITATCTSAPLPAGTGGTIAPGTYVLTAQTYYNAPGNCPTGSIAGTLVQSGSCAQQVAEFAGIALRSSTTIAVQGNQITSTPTCVSPGASGFTPDTPTKTFTATPTTLTLFTLNSAVGNPNPDRAEVFVKQ
jgi:hypothetical protein